MDYASAKRQRFAELKPGPNGRLQTEWRLTDSKLVDAVRITIPPSNAIPIIFVPGIMGSNLCNLKGDPVWLLNSVKDVPLKLAWSWSRKGPGVRQSVLHPERTKVYAAGAVPKKNVFYSHTEKEYRERGWGEVSEASYHKFLLWLDAKMNEERNPANWDDFSNPSVAIASTVAEKMIRKLERGLTMAMRGLPDIAEAGHEPEPVRSEDLLKRAKFSFPVYAFGYNWLDSNVEAACYLKSKVDKVISENNVGPIKCTQVILVTHSMGGLVARACSQLPDMSKKIAGIVHGVMPTTGAAVAYRRCKVGMKDEDLAAGLVIGSNGKEVTAVFAQSPGPLQLLPAESYGAKWLEVVDPSGKTIKALPVSDPYEEIYLERNKWWGLIREEWLTPSEGEPISWEDYVLNVNKAKLFHRSIEKKFHRNTFVFYGGGPAKGSFQKIRWLIKSGLPPGDVGVAPNPAKIPNFFNGDIRTNSSNSLYVGGKLVFKSALSGDASSTNMIETSYWEIHCDRQNSSGDGTVPASSGREPRLSAQGNVIQQFEIAGIQHEPAYKDYPVAQLVAYYAITKLAALADL
jgi:hypothetical protein